MFTEGTRRSTSRSSKEAVLKNILERHIDEKNRNKVSNFINRTNNNVKIKPKATVPKQTVNEFMNELIRGMAPKNITNEEVTRIKKKVKANHSKGKKSS